MSNNWLNMHLPSAKLAPSTILMNFIIIPHEFLILLLFVVNFISGETKYICVLNLNLA